MKPVRVLIVDDSALVREMLSSMLGSSRRIEIVGTASDPIVAREKIKKLRPDVLTLDVEMPRMDGVTFLRNLMRLHPLPVVMVSSLTEQGADVTLEALELGAIDFVTKPKVDLAHEFTGYQEELVEKVLVAAKANVRRRMVPRPPAAASAAQELSVSEKLTADAVLSAGAKRTHFRTTDQIIAIGASTGGTEAIREVIAAMPADAPGIVISQHIPEAFSGPFADRVDRASRMNVSEARDGMQVLPGHALIAPGDSHLVLVRDGARYVCRLNDGPPVNRHRPAVDVMFRSVAQSAGPNAVGCLLTGMGEDGARGLKEMLEAGARTLVQDEKTSIVWGMPGAAAKLGAAEEILPIDRICSRVLSLTSALAGGQA